MEWCDVWYANAKADIDVPRIYADYYFLETLPRYDAVMRKSKRPASFGEMKCYLRVGSGK